MTWSKIRGKVETWTGYIMPKGCILCHSNCYAYEMGNQNREKTQMTSLKTHSKPIEKSPLHPEHEHFISLMTHT